MINNICLHAKQNLKWKRESKEIVNINLHNPKYLSTLFSDDLNYLLFLIVPFFRIIWYISGFFSYSGIVCEELCIGFEPLHTATRRIGKTRGACRLNRRIGNGNIFIFLLMKAHSWVIVSWPFDNLGWLFFVSTSYREGYLTVFDLWFFKLFL